MLNWIFMALVIGGTVVAALTGKMELVTKASADSAKSAVELAIGLVGQMALWLGALKVLEEAGMMPVVARAVAPVMRRLFPDVPVDHPAMGAMIMNLAANVLGLGNAATPFGLKAMIELNRLNKRQGVATNSMALFLAINTSGVGVLPLNIIAVRATMGARDLTGIIMPSVLASCCSLLAAIIVCKTVERLARFRVERYAAAHPALPDPAPADPIKGLEAAEKVAVETKPIIGWRVTASLGVGALMILGVVFQARALEDPSQLGGLIKNILSSWMLPTILVLILLTGFSRGVKVYEAVISGAKEGFGVCVTIIPFLVAMLVAIGMFRASGSLDFLVRAVAPASDLIGMPAEALPMAFIRPLSGSGALAVVVDTMKVHGPDSFLGFLVCVMNGSTETTFYVLALYYGSVGVRETRHTLIPCLAADTAGMLGSLVFARIFYSSF